jgi:molybdate transport repressor ModE-like protein
LHDTERIFGAPLTEKRSGGAQGGGTSLNPLGRSVIKHFRAIESHAAKAIRTELVRLKNCKSNN